MFGTGSSTEKPLKRKERKEEQQRLKCRENELREEIQHLEDVSALNEKLTFEYPAPANPSTINTLRYTAMYEDGLCEICPNVYSFTVEFANITYQIAGQEDQLRIFTKYCELLNYFPHTVNVQLTVRNYYRDNETFFQSIRMPETGNYTVYAKELNRIVENKAMQGDNSLVAANYLTVSFAAKDYREAQTLSASIRGELRRYFSGLKCGYRILSGIERVRLLHSYFHDYYFSFAYSHLLASGLTTKSYIAPERFDFTENNSFSYTSNGKERFGQTIILKDLPPVMADTLIATLTGSKCELTFTTFIRPVNQETATRMVKNQRAKMDMQAVKMQEKNIQRMYHPGTVPFELRNQMEDADNLIEDMEHRNQRLFGVTLLLYTSADSPEKLQENVFKLKAAARKCNCDFAELPEQQESALNSILPLGACFIDIERNLTTSNTAVFIPFTTQEIQHEYGLCYGQNSLSHNLICVDREQSKNGNGVYTGVSGSGKSMMAKIEIAQVLVKFPKDEVLVIDPENEFSPLAEKLDGEVIEISAGSNTHLNPFDMAQGYNENDNPLLLKGEFILSLCENLLGDLNAVSKSLLDKCMRIVYEPFFKSNMDAAATPTLTDFNAILKKQKSEEAKTMSAALELYTEGSLSAFAHLTNVNVNNRFTVFNTLKLGGQLKHVGMLIVIDQLWNRALANHKKGIRTWVYADEMQVFFDTETSSQYFSDIWARFRKRGAFATGLTQNVRRLLDNGTARFILSNSEIVVMLSQAKEDKQALAELLDISEEQQEYITDAEPGNGLLRVGHAIVPFVNKIPENTQLYRVMSTKAADFRENA